MNKIAFVFLTSLLTASCSPIYVAERGWSTCSDPKTCAPDENFHRDITACVSAFDPGHLDEVDSKEGYRISGWFIDGDRVEPVVSCMRKKHWWVMGPAL